MSRKPQVSSTDRLWNSPFGTGHGLPARQRHRPQGPQVEEHLPGERQGHHHRLWPLQCLEAVQERRVIRRVPPFLFAIFSLAPLNEPSVVGHIQQEDRRAEHSARMALLPGARSDALPQGPQRGERPAALHHGLGRLLVRVRVLSQVSIFENARLQLRTIVSSYDASTLKETTVVIVASRRLPLKYGVEPNSVFNREIDTFS